MSQAKKLSVGTILTILKVWVHWLLVELFVNASDQKIISFRKWEKCKDLKIFILPSSNKSIKSLITDYQLNWYKLSKTSSLRQNCQIWWKSTKRSLNLRTIDFERSFLGRIIMKFWYNHNLTIFWRFYTHSKTYSQFPFKRNVLRCHFCHLMSNYWFGTSHERFSVKLSCSVNCRRPYLFLVSCILIQT